MRNRTDPGDCKGEASGADATFRGDKVVGAAGRDSFTTEIAGSAGTHDVAAKRRGVILYRITPQYLFGCGDRI
jgi:hypothetical protein